MLTRALALAETSLAASSAEAASTAFHAAMTSLGASYLQTRVYRRPIVPLTSQAHFAAGGGDRPDRSGRLARKRRIQLHLL